MLYLLWALPAVLFGQLTPEQRLRAYEGRWVGSFSIHSTSTGEKIEVPVEQVFWWDEGRLLGVSVMDLPDGLESSRSRMTVHGSNFAAKIIRGEKEQDFIGTVFEDGLLWVPADLRRVESYQLKERITGEGAERRLVSEGFEVFLVDGEPAPIVYKGELRFEAE